MIEIVEKRYCTGCGVCAAVCPRGAVQMETDAEGFWYPKVRRALCTDCGACKRVCPLTQEPARPSERVCFGAGAAAAEVRRLGSSGGIFPLLAARVLQDGGSVWGAALLEDGAVQHMEIRDEADIGRISRTKYVQSDMGPVWEQIRRPAERGRPVLFCGTPCQTDAVRSFLGPDRGGVILVDLICYGVPSPEVWRQYTAYLSQQYGGPFRSFSFRDKRNGDNGHLCAARLGEREYTWPLARDLYCRSVFLNINLRPSCFRCRYCTTARSSDITLGDFWGIEKVRPGFDDGMGCSVVICHTEAGRRLWERIRPEVRWFPCTEQEAANEMQPRLREPARPHPRRGLYMGLRHVMPFSRWIKLF